MLRTGRAFYDDQMTHHAPALTYDALMPLFPRCYSPSRSSASSASTPRPTTRSSDICATSSRASALSSLRAALQQKGTAATTLAISVVVTLYGTTGALEAARRALNVVFKAASRVASGTVVTAPAPTSSSM